MLHVRGIILVTTLALLALFVALRVTARAEGVPRTIRARAVGGEECEKARAEKGPLALELAKANLKLRAGESIVYDVRVNGMPAGKASLEVAKTDTMDLSGGPSVWITRLNIRSNRAVSLFYDVHTRATSKIDVNGGFSRFYNIERKDGEISNEESAAFDYDIKTMTAHYERRRLNDSGMRSNTIPLCGNVLDPLSAIYYLRSVEFSKYKVGDSIELPVCADRRVWSGQLKVLSMGRGDFGDLRKRSYVELKADVPFKGLFERKGAMIICVDAQTGVPLRMDVEIPIGTAEVEISDHTKSPFEPNFKDKDDN